MTAKLFVDLNENALVFKGYLITYGNRPRKRERLMARASSRCLRADTAVMRLGTILPRSEI